MVILQRYCLLLPVLLLVEYGVTHVKSLDNGLAKTPPMGYNTWYDVTGEFDEQLLKDTVDAFIKLNLKKFGYNYWK